MTDDLQTWAAGVMCAGFDGTEIDARMRARLEQVPLAGLILFGRNVQDAAQTRRLTGQIREVYSNPIVAVDQEGGRVARLRNGVEELPSMMAVAATGQVDLARRAGEQIAFDLRRVGINVDFAPVLDLALFPENTVIGARSFGDDPHEVAGFAGAFASGMLSQSVVPTFKHFPGHGSTARDSHVELPFVDEEQAVLRARDLVPFERLLPDALAVMTAHVVVRAFDRENPATVSKAILTGLLRDELGFGGVCFTDCMEMDAIARGIGSAQAAVQALQAGADCILVSRSFEVVQESIARIVAAVQSGALTRSRLQEAYQRVCSLRAALKPPLPFDEPPPEKGIGREIGRRAVTLLRGEPSAAPDASVVISFEGATTEGAQGTYSNHAVLTAAQPIPAIRLELQPAATAVRQAAEQVRASGRRPIILMRRAHVYREQWNAVTVLLEQFRDALVVSVREPFDALSLHQAAHLLCTYGDDAPSVAGLSEVIFGSATPQGRLPVRGTHETAGR